MAIGSRLQQRLLHSLLNEQVDGQTAETGLRPQRHVEGPQNLRTAPINLRKLSPVSSRGSRSTPPLPVLAPPPAAVRFAFRSFVPRAEPSPRSRCCHGGSSAALQGRVSEALLVGGGCRRPRGLRVRSQASQKATEAWRGWRQGVSCRGGAGLRRPPSLTGPAPPWAPGSCSDPRPFGLAALWASGSLPGAQTRCGSLVALPGPAFDVLQPGCNLITFPAFVAFRPLPRGMNVVP